MKRAGIILMVLLMFRIFSNAQTGASCATAIPITLDSVLRTYTISSSTGANLICTSSGTTSITYFKITSNSSAQSMLLDITGSAGQPIEVGFYNGVTCNNGAFESASSICLYDGTGLWAPAESFSISPNTTYTLRIKTQTTGTIQISGQHYTPPNNDCLNATELGTILIYDENANHMPGPGVTPAQLCAATLENTAFYYYTVETDGVSGVSFENLTCDNNYGNNMASLGFHFGLFTGDCSSLTNIGCHTGPPFDVQFNIGSLPAGTKVYMAMDGISGSNCYYGVRAINAIILSATLKYFSGWKTNETNNLKWVSLKENGNKTFEIQRSVNGINFVTIGQVSGQINSKNEKTYQYNDAAPPDYCFYRLRMVSTAGKYSYSDIIKINRGNNIKTRILSSNITNQLSLLINGQYKENFAIKIIDNSGRSVKTQVATINSGENLIHVNTGSLPEGMYYLILSGDNYKKTFPFLKS